jgi:hypothetical protein
VSTLGRSVVKGKLPFTGISLWPILLAALGLGLTGLLLRRFGANGRT